VELGKGEEIGRWWWEGEGEKIERWWVGRIDWKVVGGAKEGVVRRDWKVVVGEIRTEKGIMSSATKNTLKHQ